MSNVGCRWLCLGIALSAGSTVAYGQTDAAYPTKPVRIIAGFTPGSATDVTARVFAQKLSEAFGTTVAVENIPGAAGTVGAG